LIFLLFFDDIFMFGHSLSEKVW